MDDKLREMARQAVVGIDPEEHPASIRLHAVRDLREADGAKRTLAEYAAAVDWAIDHPSATDLPVGSVVADEEDAYIKVHPGNHSQWRCTDRGSFDDGDIDRYLGLNARLLRVGTGED